MSIAPRLDRKGKNVREKGTVQSRFLCVAVCLAALLLGVRSARVTLAAEGQADAPPTADELMDKMAEAFKGVQTLEATGKASLFEQAGGRTGSAELSFELKLRRPDRLYYKVSQQSGGLVVVWDGSTGWISALHFKQFQKYEGIADLLHFLPRASAVLTVAGLPVSYAHNLLLADPKTGMLEGVTETQVQSPTAASTYSLVLTRGDGEVVTLSAARNDFLLQGIAFDLTEVVRKQATAAGRTLPTDYKSTATVVFTDTKVNQPVEETAFTFTPPEGFALVTRFGTQPLTGKPAPDFTLNDLSDKPVTLSALRGKVVILDFWSTQRGPCQVSMPRLEKLHQEFATKGLMVLGVTNEEKAVVEPFLKANNLTFTILLDPKQVAITAYRVDPIPRTLIIDQEGRVAADFTGLQEESTLRSELTKLGIK